MEQPLKGGREKSGGAEKRIMASLRHVRAKQQKKKTGCRCVTVPHRLESRRGKRGKILLPEAKLCEEVRSQNGGKIEKGK